MWPSERLALISLDSWQGVAQARRRDRRGIRPTVTLLEERHMLSTLNLTVTTLADPSGPASTVSLRQAINTANDDTTDSQEIISFAAGLTGTINLSTALPNLANNISITGPGASNLKINRVSSAANFSIFTIHSGRTVNISNITIENGNAGTATYGGGICSFGTLTLTNNTFTDNTATVGGGICSFDTLTLTNSTFTDNTASYFGGGIGNESTLTLTNSTFTDNTANEVAGGIYNYGSLTLTNSTFTDNAAVDGGGGIYNGNGYTLTLTNSTFTDNTATSWDSDGGGIMNYGLLTLINSTFTDNTAGGGGGVFNDDTLMLTNSTFTDNTATGWGGGIFNDNTLDDTLMVNNTIIAGNTGNISNDIQGPIATTSSNNLIGNGAGITDLSSLNSANLIGTSTSPINPDLGPLQNNGGPTETMGLLPGSPAIGTGSVALDLGLPYDQRGASYPRAVNGTVDIGAYEYPPDAMPTVSVVDSGGVYNNTTYTATATVNGQPSLEGVTPTLDYQQYVNGTWTDLGTSAPVNAGSYDVTANFAGSTDYTAVSSSTVDFTIAQAPLTIIAVYSTKTYDGTTTVTDGATPTVTGLVGTDSVTGLSESFASPNVLGTNCSTLVVNSGYVVDDGNGGSNYVITTVNTATGTITPATPLFSDLSASQTITYGGPTNTGGDITVSGVLSVTGSNPLVTPGTEVGLNQAYVTVAVDGHSVQSPVASNGTFSDTIFAGTIPVIGSPYTISYSYAGDATSGGNLNAAETDTSTTLTVNAAPLTITANSATWVYGTPQPLTYTASGLQNSETIGNVVLTTNATTSGSGNVNAGTWTITSSDATGGTFTASNYNITYVAGSLVVTPASVTGSFTAANKPYDGATTATVTGTSLTGVLGTSPNADNVQLTFSSATYGSPNAGTQTVTLNGAGLSGTDAGDYSLVTPITTTASIAQVIPSFSDLSTSQTITYGTSEILVSGTLSVLGSNPFLTPGTDGGQSVTISVDGQNVSTGVVSSGPTSGTFSVEIPTATIPVGSYAISYSYAGDSNFTAAATDTSTSLTVNPASLTVTGSSASMVYGNRVPTFTTSALPPGVTETTTIVDPVYSTSGNLAVPPGGTYALDTVLGGPGLSNYSPTVTDGTLTVTPLAITGNFTAANKTYDGTTTATVASTSLTGVLGTSPNADNLQLTYTSAIFASANANSTPQTVTLNGASLTGSDASDYSLVTSITTTATINQAPLTITANNASGNYGFTPVLNGVSYTGFLNGETQSVLTTLPTVTTSATSASSVGTYTITASGAVDPNYAISYQPGTYTVTPATLTITATSQSKVFGTTAALSYTATGLVNGNTITDLQESSTGAVSTANVGSYPIDISAAIGPGLPNYNINYLDGTLTVTKATATIVVTPYSVTYNGLAHSATGTATGVNGVNLNSDLTINSTHTDAGTYTDSWSFNAGSNYNTATGNMTDTIAKATASVIVTPYDVTYDGNAHTATGTAQGVGGVSLPASDLTLNTTHTNAGTYTDSWTFSDPNYVSQSGTVTDTILKANASINVVGYNTFYNATSHSATGTPYGLNGTALPGLNLVGTIHTSVGTYIDTWTFTDTTGNYNNASGTVVDTITPSKSKMVRETVNVPKTTVVKATVLVPGIKEVKVVERVQVNGKWVKKTVLVPETVLVKKTVLVNVTKMSKKTEMVRVYYS